MKKPRCPICQEKATPHRLGAFCENPACPDYRIGIHGEAVA